MELKSYDWIYQISFNSNLARRVRSFIKKHASDEKELLQYKYDFYSKRLSLLSLIEKLSSGAIKDRDLNIKDLRRKELLPLNEYGRDKLNKMLYGIRDRIREENFLFLKNASSEACKNKNLTEISLILKEIFGIHYKAINELLKEADKDYILSNKSNDLKVEEIEEFVAGYIKKLSTGKYPDFDIYKCDYNFKLELKKGYDFAEYWPRELLKNEKESKLLVYKSPNNLIKGDLKRTLIHELFPGHGLFYDLMSKAKDTKRDYGAFALIEGWATYCEWNYLPDAFSLASKAYRIKTAAEYIKNDKINEEAFKAAIKIHGYSDKLSEELFLEKLQYPGLQEFYCYGAFFFEKILKEKKVSEFFSEMKKRSWGDFFALWK